MAERLVAVDASPVIGLSGAGAFEVLRQLFGMVVVTRKSSECRGSSLLGRPLAGGVLEGPEHGVHPQRNERFFWGGGTGRKL